MVALINMAFLFVAKSFRLRSARGTGSGNLIDFREKASNNYGSLPNITFVCQYDWKTKHSSWKWRNVYNYKQYSVLPTCAVSCRDDPPPENPPTLTRVWKDVTHWESKDGEEIPIYICGKGTTLQFKNSGASNT